MQSDVSFRASGSLLTALQGRRIFFAHQSVGDNIVDGLSELLAENPNLTIHVVRADGAIPQRAFFAHARVGSNGNPRSKTQAFRTALDSGLGQRLDIALHKYCFADIAAATNVEALFESYRTEMRDLSARYPKVVFVHVTTPLMQVQAGVKARVKAVLGRPPDYFLDNLRREEFNALMRREYEGHEPLFDLANWEATRQDGTRETTIFQGRTTLSLLAEYTADGAHLNETGRRWVAKHLLETLAQAAVEGQHE